MNAQSAHSIRGPGFGFHMATPPPDSDATAPNHGTSQEQSGGPIRIHWRLADDYMLHNGGGGASINSRMAMDKAGMFVLDGL